MKNNNVKQHILKNYKLGKCNLNRLKASYSKCPILENNGLLTRSLRTYLAINLYILFTNSVSVTVIASEENRLHGMDYSKVYKMRSMMSNPIIQLKSIN